jgi:hypothetical protein
MYKHHFKTLQLDAFCCSYIVLIRIKVDSVDSKAMFFFTDECSDPNLNNCTGDHVQCIDLYEGFECGCASPYEWNSTKAACFLSKLL